MGICMKKFIMCFGFLVLANPFLFSGEKTEKVIDHSRYERIVQRATQLCSKEDIEKAFDRMAAEITQQLSEKNPTFVCVLSGAIVPMGQLLTRLDFPLKIDYLNASHYNGKVKGSELHFTVKPKESLKDKVIVLVDDIIDTGKTLQAVIDFCYQEGAKEVYTAVMIDKKRDRDEKGLYKADFVGLQIPDKFIVGYGLDYEQYFRNLDGIYVMPEKELF